MDLTRLIYYSEVTKQVDRNTLRDILASAHNNNARDQVTGILCYNSKYFIQALEGERVSVSRTFCRIVGNPLHRDPVIVTCGPVRQRAFGDWWMAYTDDPAIVSKSIRKYSSTPVLEPHQMSPATLQAFLQDVWRLSLRRKSNAKDSYVLV
ncbi:MAG: BLUF domain-containing protein [Alphaproteobacteria bacterium]|nr:BLUF domain-containing protein [Alphaproteobacteria bacterium]